MTTGTDRRSVLTGLGALGVAACGPAPEAAADLQSQSPHRLAGPPRQIDLSALEATHGGRIGLDLVDTLTGRRLGWRNGERFLYCSTFKLFLAAATLERVARGDETLDRPVPVTAADMLSHAPVTEPAVGGTLTIQQLCQAVVEVSDNPAANLLTRELGGLDALRNWYRSLDDATTSVDRPEPGLNRVDGDRDTILPSQAVANIERIMLTDRLTAAHRGLLKDWMLASPTGPDRIKASVPTDYRVAHKTGTSGQGHVNDIGILYPPSREPLVIAVYYEGRAEASTAQREAVIAEATRITLKALGHD